jgi:hypothetical protein
MKAHGKDQNQIEKICAVKFTARFKNLYICCRGEKKIEHFAVRDRMTHGKMLSVRPRRQIGRARGTKPPGCRGYLFAVRFGSRVPCVVFLPCVSLKYAVCSCFAVCLIYICRELLICRGLGGLAHGIVCYAVRRPTAPDWRTATPDFAVVITMIRQTVFKGLNRQGLSATQHLN